MPQTDDGCCADEHCETPQCVTEKCHDHPCEDQDDGGHCHEKKHAESQACEHHEGK